MPAQVASLICPRERVAAVLAAAFKDCAPVWHIAERIERIVFAAGLPDWEEHWRSGSVFWHQWEVRWREWGEHALITFLTEELVFPPLPEGIGDSRVDQDWHTGSDMHMPLRGSYHTYPQACGFIEVRIPHILDYPAPFSGAWKAGDEAILVAVPYKKNGAVQFLRFKELKAVR